MEEKSTSWTDLRVELLIGSLLRIGVITAAVVVLMGGLIFLARHGGDLPHYAVFAGEPSALRSLFGVLRSAAHFQGRGIIQLGLLLLIATPVARVAFSIAAFVMERDWMYVAFASIVLAVLIFGLFGGHI
jgi:uncharacterized membrane protein